MPFRTYNGRKVWVDDNGDIDFSESDKKHDPRIIPQGRTPNRVKEQVKTMARNLPFPFNEREMERKLMVQNKTKQEDLARQEEYWKQREWHWRKNER